MESGRCKIIHNLNRFLNWCQFIWGPKFIFVLLHKLDRLTALKRTLSRKLSCKLLKILFVFSLFFLRSFRVSHFLLESLNFSFFLFAHLRVESETLAFAAIEASCLSLLLSSSIMVLVLVVVGAKTHCREVFIDTHRGPLFTIKLVIGKLYSIIII